MTSQEFTELLSKLDILEELKGCFTDAQLEELLPHLKDNMSITSLSFFEISYVDVIEKIKKIAEYLKVNNTVKSLCLTKQDLGCQEAEIIAKILRNNNTLASLNLSGNSLDDEAVEMITQALEKNTSLTHLDLGENVFGDEGAMAIAKMLKKNKSIISIRLGENLDIVDGLGAISEIMKYNTNITILVDSHDYNICELNKRNRERAKAILNLLKFLKISSGFTPQTYAYAYTELSSCFGLAKYMAEKKKGKYGDLYRQLDDIYNDCKEGFEQHKKNILIMYGLNKTDDREVTISDMDNTLFIHLLTKYDISHTLPKQIVEEILQERDALYRSEEHIKQSMKLRESLTLIGDDLIKLQIVYKKSIVKLTTLENDIKVKGVYATQTLIKYFRSTDESVRKILVTVFASIDSKYMSMLDNLKSYVSDKIENEYVQELKAQITIRRANMKNPIPVHSDYKDKLEIEAKNILSKKINI